MTIDRYTLSGIMTLKPRFIYGAMAVGGAVGLVASFLQTIEKIQLLKQAEQALVCDLNSVFSCTSVLNAWQSSVFGFPNSLLCIVFFTIFMTVGLVGLSGGVLPRKLRLAVHGLALFVLAFGLWFLWQSTYSIGALCLYCLFCFSGLLLVNWAWLRHNVDILPISSSMRTALKRGMQGGADTFAWLLFAVFIGFLMLLKFY